VVRGYHKKTIKGKLRERENSQITNIIRVSIHSSGSRWQRYSNHDSARYGEGHRVAAVKFVMVVKTKEVAKQML